MSSKAALEETSPASNFLILIGLFLVCLVVFSLLGLLVAMFFAHITSLSDIGKLADFSNPNVVMALKMNQIVSAIGSFIVPAFFFAMLVSKNKLEYLGLKKSPDFMALLLAGTIMLAALPFINWMAALNGRLVLPAFLSGVENWMKASQAKATEITQAFLSDHSVGGLFLNLFIVGLLAAVSEELFFRGVLQKVMISWTKNIHWGVWITGILFSAFHFEFYGFLPRMMMGVFLGYIYVWSKSIWIPIFAHFVNNGTEVLVDFLEQNNKLPKNIDQAGAAANDWWQVLVSIFIIGILLFIFYKWTNREKPSLVNRT